ncbi:MAG: hypothetical protein JKY48_06855 [Flavobacteriales bacterium]|nr:hypothetical protein [Flavobacteriales bacterium]
MKKGIKVALITAAILMTVPTFAQGVKKGHNREKAKAEMEAMFTSLELNERQREKVKSILKDERIAMKDTKLAKEKLGAMDSENKKVARAKAVLRRDRLKKRTEMKLNEVLTPSQMRNYKVIQEERVERRQERREERVEHKPMKKRPTDASSD